MESPDTLSQVINRLQQQGYTADLNRHEDNPLRRDPNTYQVDEIFRFEGPSSPDDDRVAGAIDFVRSLVGPLSGKGHPCQWLRSVG